MSELQSQTLPPRTFLQLLLNRRVLVVLLLGFSSGLPLALSTSALQAWFTVDGINIEAIGFLSLIGLPYVYKFAWSPLMDRFVPPLLGRRRGWMLVTQIGLIILLIVMAFGNPKVAPLWLGFLGLLVAFCSASQDIAINAYSTDVLRPEERGMGAAMTTGGYRIAMLVSGGVALILADKIGWRFTFVIMALCMLVGVIATFWGPNPENDARPPQTLFHAVVEPFKEFMQRKGLWVAIAIMVFIVVYKLSDASAGALTTTFLLRGLHFTLTDVGVIVKIMSLVGSVLGVFVGGYLLARIGLFYSLFWFGVLQAISNLSYVFLAIIGKSFIFASISLFIENLCGGMGTAAFVALLMSLCNTRYTATQFALLSALSAVGRVFVGPLAGVMVHHMGWEHFYIWTVFFALPGLVLLWWLREPLMAPGTPDEDLPDKSTDSDLLNDSKY